MSDAASSIGVLTELQDGAVTYRAMIKPRLAQRAAPIMRVTLQAERSGNVRPGLHQPSITTVRATADHKFYLANGKICQVKDLRPKDRIESAYRLGREPSIRTTGGVGITEKQAIAEYEYDRWYRDSLICMITQRRRVAQRQTEEIENHLVVKVEPDGHADVYCGTVPTSGRFFISLGDAHAEGILVSNCGI